MLAATGSLGGVQREIGVADQGIGAGAARIADRNADRGTDRHLVTLDRVGARHLLDQGFGERFEQAGLDRSGQNGLEFVAAEAPDLAVDTHHRFQPLGDLAEEGIADRMPQRVIDVFEPIEIDQEQGTALLPARSVAQCLLERLAHHRTIGQPGQRIEPGEAGDFLLRAALFSQVGANPAEAHEAAIVVEDRIARKRPVDVVIGCGADDHVGKWETRRQVEAEGAFLAKRAIRACVDRQQGCELTAE